MTKIWNGQGDGDIVRYDPLAPVPFSAELLEDVRPGVFAEEVRQLFLDSLHGPRFGPRKPRKVEVWVPHGRPAGPYRRVR